MPKPLKSGECRIEYRAGDSFPFRVTAHFPAAGDREVGDWRTFCAAKREVTFRRFRLVEVPLPDSAPISFPKR